MMTRFSIGLLAGIFAWAMVLICAADARAAREIVLHEFPSGLYDGYSPTDGVIADSKKNLYGTTGFGGSASWGTVFRFAPDETYTVLYSFTGGSDGGYPFAGLVMDTQGNLYGTTVYGGNNYSSGTVFKLAPDGTETVLHSFSGSSDGYRPFGGLVMDSTGNLYGTTAAGGSTSCSGYCGTVFKQAPDGTYTVLHSFARGSDGGGPLAGLVMDTQGNLYGTTYHGGKTSCDSMGCGVAFKVAPEGAETVLYRFKGGSDGSFPAAGLLLDNHGNLYGTTSTGGSAGCGGKGCGVVFKLAPDGTETVLYSFLGGNDGATPEAGLIADEAGNLYGTTSLGGRGLCRGLGCGTVFELAPDNTEMVLYAFRKKSGVHPWGGLMLDRKGDLYGTTQGDHFGPGTLFKLKR